MYFNPIPYLRPARTPYPPQRHQKPPTKPNTHPLSNPRKSPFHPLLSAPSTPHRPPAQTNASSSPAEAEAVPSPSDSPPTPASDCGGVVPQAYGGHTACLRARGHEGSVRWWFRCRRSAGGRFGRCWASFLFRRLIGMGGSMFVGGGWIGTGGSGSGGGGGG